MEGFLHHMAPQFLHPALQGFGCGAFRPIAAGAFHPLYPSKAFARHLGEQYALGQSVSQALRGVREEAGTPPLYRHGYGGAAAAAAAVAAARDDTSSPGSAASASPRPCKDDDHSPAAHACPEPHHDFFSGEGERKSSCGVCGARLGPGVAQAHFLQELQHLYSLSALPARPLPPAAADLQHQDEDARWETYQRIRANRQRRLKLRTRKRHHTVESMLGYEEDGERSMRGERPGRYDAEDETVDVEGDALCWPETHHSQGKEQRTESEKLQINYGEDLEISSTNDAVQSPERVRIETPKPIALESTAKLADGTSERPAECVSTSEWGPGAAVTVAVHGTPADPWPNTATGAAGSSALSYLPQPRHKTEGENLPSSTDPHN